jgi:hypothetical protein
MVWLAVSVLIVNIGIWVSVLMWRSLVRPRR